MNNILVKPNFNQMKLTRRLQKRIRHNYYREPAWPNDLLYIFPISILGVFAICLRFAILDPTGLREEANPFATPLEILPEWFLFPTFHILRIVSNKLLRIFAIAAIPLRLLLLPFVENLNRYQNPIRRPLSLLLFILAYRATLLLRISAALPL